MNDKYCKLWLLAAGSLIKIDVNITGRLALGEMLMLILLPYSIQCISELRQYKALNKIFVSLILWIIGCCLSDLINHNELQYFLKGVFRPIICITNLLGCFALSYKRPGNLYYFFIGLFISGVQNYILPTDSRAGGEEAIGHYQYYAYAYTPFFLGLASFGGYLLAKRSITTASILCIILGIIAFPIMSRTTASVLLLSGILIYCINKFPVFEKVNNIGITKIILVIFSLYLVAYYPYIYCAKNGYLGERQKEKFETQYNKSPLTQNPIGFLFAGRTESVGAMVRTAQSPIIGNGSWPKRGNSNMIAARLVGIDESEVSKSLLDPQKRDIGHSVFFGMWSQAGICVVPFFLLSFSATLKLFRETLKGYSETILIVPYLLIFLFSFFFNNFSSTFRFELVIFPILFQYYQTKNSEYSTISNQEI